jgi:hypothetical protein
MNKTINLTDQQGSEKTAPSIAPLHAWVDDPAFHGKILRKIKVYRFGAGDWEWIAAPDKESAIEFFKKYHGFQDDEIDFDSELTDQELDDFEYIERDADGPISGTVQLQSLIDKGEKFPMHFACSEY